MPIPKVVARFNRVVTNPIALNVAAWLPGFAIISHVGRRTGTLRRTPLNIFRDGPHWTVALMYGVDAGWVRNVLATGRCEIETRRRRVLLIDPTIVHDRSRRLVPWFVRPALGLLDVDDFLVLREEVDAGVTEA
ncbi:MAG: nitroreductase family deazaflavin-dependent oxidoreductase [Chloroflexota bacterium]